MLLFCAANLRCDNGKGGDNNHRGGRPADNRRALLEHRLEAERRADRVGRESREAGHEAPRAAWARAAEWRGGGAGLSE